MNKKEICEFLEFKSLVVTTIPFLIGLGYVLHKFNKINILYTFLFLVGSLLIHLVSNATNNYVDSKAENKFLNFKHRKLELKIIVVMSILAACVGLYLVYELGLVVLILGLIAFSVALFYTAGPTPISRTPYGEVFSGLAMGFIIPFLTVYVATPKNYLVDIESYYPIMNVAYNIKNLWDIVLLCIPIIFTTSNVMLANNICDIESDIKVKRYTLRFYLGLEKSLKLFKSLYYVSYVAIILMVAFKVISVWGIFLLLTFIPVHRNINKFIKVQTKPGTFAYSLINFVWINMSIMVFMLLSVMFDF